MNLFRQIAAKNIELNDFPFFSELNIEAYIIENPQVLGVDNIMAPEIIENQIHVHAGRSDGDGRLDLLARSENNMLIIIEVKKGLVKEDHMNQINDYIEQFKNRQNEIMEKVDKATDYTDFQLVGMLIGNDFDAKVKEKLNNGGNEIEIYGLEINRYRTPDSLETYIMTNSFVPMKSKRIRYADWDVFISQLSQKFDKNVIEIGRKIYTESLTKFSLTNDAFNFAPTVFTVNVPRDQRRTVFAYILFKKTHVRVVMVNRGTIPQNCSSHSQAERYPDRHICNIRSIEEFERYDVMSLIEDSYNILMGSF